MNKAINKLKTITFIICVLLTACAAVSAQREPATKTLAETEQQQVDTTDEAKRFYQLTRITTGAFAAGEFEKARNYANTLLIQAESFREDWNYGNAIHVANFVLGRIALVEGDMLMARRYLLESGKTPGSPQLNSFGPNMLLAKELLAEGESEVVIEYFDLCAVFWKNHSDTLDAWKTIVLDGKIPDFGANLRYQNTVF